MEIPIILFLLALALFALNRVLKHNKSTTSPKKLEIITIGTNKSQEHFIMHSTDIQEGWRADTLMVAKIKGKNPFPLGKEHTLKRKQNLYINNELIGEVKRIYRSDTSDFTFFKC